MADDLGERTEDATPKKRQEARESGQVARSQDLAAVILLVVATVTLAVASLWMLRRGASIIEAVLGGGAVTDPLSLGSVREASVFVASRAVRLAAPMLLLAWAAAFLAHFAQIGWLFAPKAVQPKLSKLDPISGFKRVFGLTALVKACIDSLKVLIVMTVAGMSIYADSARILVLPTMPMGEAIAAAGKLMLILALKILGILLILAIIDFTYQRWKHSNELKMSKQQVKDEMKQTEGDPEVKRRRMRMQQQIALQRVASSVPKADVVVTNPEHVAVALQYDADRMRAPRVVAKGADFIAQRIRQIALQNEIPIIERPPLARALYRNVAVGEEVPPDFYAAVAEVLAYVYQLSGRRAG